MSKISMREIEKAEVWVTSICIHPEIEETILHALAAEREQAVAVTDEMVELVIIAVFEQLAAVEQHGDFSSNWNGLSDLERNEIRANMRRVIEAVAPLLRGEVK